MRKVAILISTLVLAACVAFGQSSGYGSQNSETTQNSAGKNETLRGCLSKQGPDYYLTTLGANQQRYEISGDTAKLAAHVGHEISVTGNVQNMGSMASNGSQGSMMNGDEGMNGNKGMNGNDHSMMGSNQGMMNTGTIALEKFHHISATCPK